MSSGVDVPAATIRESDHGLTHPQIGGCSRCPSNKHLGSDGQHADASHQFQDREQPSTGTGIVFDCRLSTPAAVGLFLGGADLPDWN